MLEDNEQMAIDKTEQEEYNAKLSFVFRYVQLQLIEDRFFRLNEEFLIRYHQLIFQHQVVMPK